MSMQELCKDLGRFVYDPVGYAKWAFSWGQGELLNASGLRKWQEDYLGRLGQAFKERGFDGLNPVEPVRKSTSSGHGVGKSALVAILIKWVLDTRPFSKGIVTATTSDQLRTKTWAEVAKWHNCSVTKDLFDYHNVRGGMNLVNKMYPQSWRCDAMTCKEENSEAFAGLHANGSTPFYIFDEASGVPEKIFQVAQGGLTDGEPMFLLFGNPTRNSGYFHDTFGSLAHRFDLQKLDSRNVEGTNKKLFEQWIQDYGEDSDYVRVRVRGEFPRASITQLIPNDIVREAMFRKAPRHAYYHMPRIIGSDVAWFGDDRSVQWIRQGIASKIIWQGREVDSVTQAGLINQWYSKYGVKACFVDAGYGNGVIDQLKALGRNPIAVWFNGKSVRNDTANKRAEMWVKMKEWLMKGGVLPNDPDIEVDLCGVEYYTNLNGQIQLEKKEDMKKRGLASPDLGDGLALTFAEDIVLESEGGMPFNYNLSEGSKAKTDYNVLDFSEERGDTVKVDYDYL